MKTHRHYLAANVFCLSLLLGATACSPSDTNTNAGGTGGSSNTGGSKAGTGGSNSTGTGGSANTGGSNAGGSGSGGSGSGGSASGGSTGTGGGGDGTGGSASGGSTGTGGAGGQGGVADAGGEVAPPPGDGGAPPSGEFKLDIKGFMVVDGKNNFPASATHPGGDHSPEMAWTGAPADVKSFAVSLVDMQGMAPTADGKFHWILWDIPVATKGLAADLPKVSPLTMPPEVMGAKQLNLTGGKSYFGPGAGGSRPYKFQLWALDVATLPVQNMSLGAIFALLKQHKIGTVPQFDGIGYK